MRGAFVSPLQNLSYTFLGATPDYWCHVPELEAANWTDDEIVRLSYPGWRNETMSLESCTYKSLNYSLAATLGFEESNSNLTFLTVGSSPSVCHKRSFNHSQYSSTVVTQWDLVCERRVWYSTTQAVTQGGKVFGCLIFGYLLDLCGRRRVILATSVLYIISSVGAALAPTLWMYISIKGVISIMDSGSYIGCYILALEVCTPKQRSYVGPLFAVPWAVGFMALPGIAYLVQDWQWLQLALTLPSVSLLTYFWLLPESPRWLLLQGRTKDALSILQKAASMNKKTLPPDEDILTMMEDIRQRENEDSQDTYDSTSDIRALLTNIGKNTMALLRTPQMCKQTVIVFYCWFAASLVYYGVALNATNLSANEYLYIFLAGLLELPSYILLWPTIAFFGRKKTMLTLFLVCAATISSISALIIVVPDVSVGIKMFLSLTGKLAITSAFQLAFLYTAELFPTRYRPLAINGANFCARTGSAFSPYINDILGTVTIWAPSALFGSLSILAACVTALLPETTDIVLPESVSEVEGFKKSGALKNGRETQNV